MRVVPGSPAPVGDPQFIVASLLSSLKRPVVVADNARLTATGGRLTCVFEQQTAKYPKPGVQC